MHHWQPSITCGLVWVEEASCCEAYVLCWEARQCEAGQYFVRRRTVAGVFEETARGPYGPAVVAWRELAARHACRRRTAS
ncbi:hypothetical protein HII36_15640 [Nonomuraea sp. NN258]|uniref:hypothetical protein n=1 Tax=Nonomuraea antri TaxID=2730852 RepID=UPI00156967E8|nr:hypothetical protein [Nonomuraea antri]NRQ33268.1 hypothetical protein [Nonomuraea antri]